MDITKQSPSNWLDAFLVFDLLIVSVLVFIDFMLGREGRAKLRDRIGWWWLRLDDVSYSETLELVGRKLYGGFLFLFGRSLHSLRFWVGGGLLAGAVYFPAYRYAYDKSAQVFKVVLLAVQEGERQNGQPDIAARAFLAVSSDAFERSLGSIKYLQFSLTLAVVFVLLALARNILLKLSMAHPAIFYIKVSIGTIAIWSLVTGGLVWLAFAQNPPLWDAMFGGPLQPPKARFDFSSPEYWSFSRRVTNLYTYHSRMALYISMFAVCVTCLAPCVIYIFAAALILLIKKTSWLWKNFTAKLLQRLYESDKGILTLVAAFLGATAKLIQESVKLIH